ncbi:SDR family NAD(P)-dependent oxidoreductase [Pseudonocardia sp. EV170527-09]|nr:SDR family NAD(P)-dependent oxidoreductase [Pseudonocardia sp. EV170527-09]
MLRIESRVIRRILRLLVPGGHGDATTTSPTAYPVLRRDHAMLFRSTTDRSRPVSTITSTTSTAAAVLPVAPAAATAADVLAGVDLTGRRAVVTGATTGVGLATARALAAAGAEVTLAVRDAEVGAVARAGIVADTGNERVAVGELDLSDQRSIARFVRLWDGPLHMLVHAAAVAGAPLTRTVDDWELHLAVNHLGPASLTSGLHWALTAVDGARVVTVTSAAHRDAAFDPEDPHFSDQRYDAHLAGL